MESIMKKHQEIITCLDHLIHEVDYSTKQNNELLEDLLTAISDELNNFYIK